LKINGQIKKPGEGKHYTRHKQDISRSDVHVL